MTDFLTTDKTFIEYFPLQDSQFMRLYLYVEYYFSQSNILSEHPDRNVSFDINNVFDFDIDHFQMLTLSPQTEFQQH